MKGRGGEIAYVFHGGPVFVAATRLLEVIFDALDRLESGKKEIS